MFKDLIARAIQEDSPSGDISSNSSISEKAVSTGRAIVKGDYVVSGMELAKEVYNYVDKNIEFSTEFKDSDSINKGQTLFTVKGRTKALLLAERTTLNIVGHMMGIATRTKNFVDLVSGTKAKILDTRKTTPGLRALEKLAVTHGGGFNHRFSLSDAVLLKENHIASAGSIKKALLMFEAVKKNDPKMKIEIEVRNLNELKEVLESSLLPDVVMLDNMSTQNCIKAVTLVAGKLKLEASGGITEKNIREYANTGVDYISLGTLTHSVVNADISFLLDTVKGL